MLADGELDALVTARAPSTFHKEPDKVKRLFPNYVEVEKEYYRRTKIFPTMHTVVIRRDVYEKNPWVAQSLYKAFTEAKARAYALYDQTAALPAMVPWLLAELEEARREMGEDWWPYGLEPNRKVLETFLRYHHEQGLSKRRFNPEELFAPETLKAFKTLVYRGMDRAALDAAYNNAAAVKDSAQIVAGWEARSARLRAKHPEGMDLRYGKDERNRIDYFAARRDAPVLAFIHGGYWQARAKELFAFVAEGPLAWGINVALVGYTLAPQKRLDGIVAEIHAALDWLSRP